MRIDCLHGYFKFTETRSGQLQQFANYFRFDLTRSGDHFTFLDLFDAPKHSIAGGTFLGIPTTATFEGQPWEVMRENGLVYNFITGKIVPIASIVQTAKLDQAATYLVSSGMILPGSITDDGRVTDYSAHYDAAMSVFRYSEVEYE